MDSLHQNIMQAANRVIIAKSTNIFNSSTLHQQPLRRKLNPKRKRKMKKRLTTRSIDIRSLLRTKEQRNISHILHLSHPPDRYRMHLPPRIRQITPQKRRRNIPIPPSISSSPPKLKLKTKKRTPDRQHSSSHLKAHTYSP